MSGEEARQAQVAEVLAAKALTAALGVFLTPDHPTHGGAEVNGEWTDWQTLAEGMAPDVIDALRAAGLIAPPPPRTWQAGDDGPIAASVVTDAKGRPWLYVGIGMWFDGTTRIGDRGLLDKYGPVTAVTLPGAPS